MLRLFAENVVFDDAQLTYPVIYIHPFKGIKIGVQFCKLIVCYKMTGSIHTQQVYLPALAVIPLYHGVHRYVAAVFKRKGYPVGNDQYLALLHMVCENR